MLFNLTHDDLTFRKNMHHIVVYHIMIHFIFPFKHVKNISWDYLVLPSFGLRFNTDMLRFRIHVGYLCLDHIQLHFKKSSRDRN